MTAMNDFNRVLVDQFRAAAGLLEALMADVTPEVAHWRPAGLANPIGATYAHAITSIDGIIHGLLQGREPLFASTFAGKTGMSEPPPRPDARPAGQEAFALEAHAWASRVTIDLTLLGTYASAVRASAEEWLSTATPADFNKPVDLSFLGLGMSTAGFVLHNAVLSHAASHAGEIAALKGLQGLKGYPM
ncbi:MAG TPA: DinB family protein [Candidatus Deferrimicrobiaceae bacterium]